MSNPDITTHPAFAALSPEARATIARNAVLAEIADLSEALHWGAEAQAEITAEYRGEVARFGDAWPGAAIQVANGAAALRADEARLWHLESTHGLLPVHGPAVPVVEDDYPF